MRDPVEPAPDRERLSAEFVGGFPDSLVEVLGTDVELLGDLLLGLQPGLLHGLRKGAFADDDQGGLPGVDELSELLDVRP